MLQTDTIPTPGWWLLERGFLRLARPLTNPDCISLKEYSDGSVGTDVELGQARIAGYTHDPEAVLAWVREGVLP